MKGEVKVLGRYVLGDRNC